jgi:hypothetical protein
MRRVASALPRRVAPTAGTIVFANPTNSAVHRSFATAFDVFCSLCWLATCMSCWACWGNNIMNLRKFGAYRFRYSLDETILPLDFKVARYVGGAFGFLYWWFMVAPQKYNRSDLEKFTTRIGPF